MSLDGYPNAITGNYAPRCACVCLGVLHARLCAHFRPLGSDALINRQLLCYPNASHTENKQKEARPALNTLTQTQMPFTIIKK